MRASMRGPAWWRWVALGVLLGGLIGGFGMWHRADRPPTARPAEPSRTATPSPAPSPTPSPPPTLRPEEWLERARRALRIGAFEEAAAAYAMALEGRPTPKQAEEAWIGLGRAWLAAEQPERAAQALERAPLAAMSPEAARIVWALLGEARERAGDPVGAAAAYHQALALGTPLAVEIRLREAAALAQAGRWEAAAAALRAALPLARDRAQEAMIRERLAEALEAMEAYPAALEQYTAILAFAQIPAYRAEIEERAAAVLWKAGQTAEAIARWQALAQRAPETPAAYRALVRLLETGIPVPDDLRGRIDAAAGQCLPAVQAFERWIAARPDHGDLHFEAARCYRDLGNRAAAHAHLDALIRDHPTAARWGDAWLEKGRLWIQSGAVADAVALWQRFLQRHPEHPFTPTLLWEAARLLERNGAEAAAEAFYRRLAEGFPSHPRAPEAWHRLGVLRYARGDLAGAAAAWEALEARYPETPWALTARFWQGKVAQARGDPAAAEAAWQAVATRAAGRFLGERARHLQRGVDPFAVDGPPVFPEPEEGRGAAEAWLAARLNLTDTAALRTAAFTADPLWVAGEEAWRMGWWAEARSLWTALRQRLDGDPVALYGLALAFRERGADPLAAQAAARLLARLGVDPLAAPPFLARLAYPTPYREQVLAEAQRYGLDPLLLYAMMRQESLFDPWATSVAQARGLMQIIPPTAHGLAAALGMSVPESWLYRPWVSLAFGAYYLAQQRDRFGGNLWVAVAAYNGGPGNAARWWAAARGDPDLFYERISLEETRRYLERITEHLAVYRALYRPGPP